MSRICVKNIGKNCSEQQLKDTFGQKGEITDVKIVRNHKNGLSRNFAFIGFRNDLQANEAIQYFNNTFIGLSRIVVEAARKLDDPTLKEKKEKFLSKTSPSSSPQIQTKKKPMANETKGELSKNKKAFLEVVKKTNATMEEQAVHNTSSLPEQESSSESEYEQLPDNKEEIEEENDSEIDLDDLLRMQSTQPASKTVTVVDEKSSLQKMTDLDYLRSRMTKAFSDSEEDDEEEEKEEEERDRKPRKESVGDKSASDQSHPGATDREEDDEHQHQQQHPSEPTDNDRIDSSHAKDERENSDVESELDEHRLFLKNLPYCTTEDELRELGQSYGQVSEVHIPIDSISKRNKGIGFITFLFPAEAEKAMKALHGSSFQGRLIYVTAAKKMKERDITVIDHLGKEGKFSSFQQKKEAERRKLLHQKEGWNASYVRSDAVIESLAERYQVNKATLLDTELKGGDVAVRLAIAETQILQENKDFFASHGINLDVLESQHSTTNQKVQRSSTTLLIKNLPPETNEEELEAMFAK